MDRLAFVIRETPYNTRRVGEALRTALGMTLKVSEITVVLAGDGVWALLPAHPDVIDGLDLGEYLQSFQDMGGRLVAEKEALDVRGLSTTCVEPLRLSRPEIARVLAGLPVMGFGS